jgi:hypothetical protein
MSLRSVIRSMVMLALGLLLVSGTALAANPHFIGNPSATLTGDSLVVSFKAAGLGNVSQATFNLDGDVELYSRCYNKGGNKPQADNKQETIPVDAEETFPVRNGQTTGSFVIPLSSTLTCPGNQRVVIESITYDLLLTGEGLSYPLTS